MKPVNLFRVSRIRDERLFNIMEKHEASDHDNHRIRIHEIDSLRILTDALAGQGIKVKDTEYIYPLNQPRELEFEGVLDKAHLMIHDGCIEFVESPCRDKICIHMGQARKDGDFLACLPNRIIVTVEGGVHSDTDN